MEIDEYHRIATVQEQHWWYVNTRSLMLEFLGPWLAEDQEIIDVGCGPGGNARALTVHGRVTGIDRASEALVWIRPRGVVRAVRADAAALPMPSGVVDVATCVHVLHALADHHLALEELARVLAPGGVAFLMEPAFPVLRRGHDRKVHGARRFRRGELEAAASAAGLSIRRTTFAYSFLALPAAFLAAVDRARPAAPEDLRSDLQRPRLDAVFGPLSAAERRLLRRRRLPFGTSVVVVATSS